MYGLLHYRWLDMGKSRALSLNKGNFDKTLIPSPRARADLKWRVDSSDTAYNAVSHGEPAFTIATDASKLGWGCTLQDTPTGGQWTLEEASMHINYLDITALLLGLQSFEKIVQGKHISPG